MLRFLKWKTYPALRPFRSYYKSDWLLPVEFVIYEFLKNILKIGFGVKS